LQEHVIPKPVPLIIPKIRVGVEVTLINTITHAFEVFKTLDIVLKDTHVVKRLGSQPIILAEHVDTTSEQHVDDLTAIVK
jgi:hypothetical protein